MIVHRQVDWGRPRRGTPNDQVTKLGRQKISTPPHPLYRPTPHHPQPPVGGKTAPLFVHRFANGGPMLDTNTSASCALAAGAASKSSWRNLGLKISPSRLQRRDGRLRFLLTEAPTPLKVRIAALLRVFEASIHPPFCHHLWHTL